MCFILFTSNVAAQKNQLERDPAALALLARSVAATGGTVWTTQVPPFRGIGTMTVGSDVGTFRCIYDGAEFRYEVNIDARQNIYVSNHGAPKGLWDRKKSDLPPHSGQGEFPGYIFPVLLWRAANLNSIGVTLDSPVTINGIQIPRLKLTYQSDIMPRTLTQTWYIDPNSAVPFIVEYHVPSIHDSMRSIRYRDQFSGFSRVNGVLLPLHIDRFADDQLQLSIDIATASFGESTQPADFEIGGEQ